MWLCIYHLHYLYFIMINLLLINTIFSSPTEQVSGVHVVLASQYHIGTVTWETRSYTGKTVWCPCCVSRGKLTDLYAKIFYVFMSVSIYFCWPFGINDSNTISIENWIKVKPVLVLGGDRCCIFHYLSWTDSMGSSLHFSLPVSKKKSSYFDR